MKKTAGIIVLILSLIFGIFLLGSFDRAGSYSSLSVSEEEFDAIMQERVESDALVPALVFDEEALFLDRSAKTFYYSLIEGHANAYDPSVRIKDNEKNLRLAVLEGEITDGLLRENRGIPLLVYTDSAYCLYTLHCTTLPLMNIECSGEIGDEAIPMRISLFDNQKGAVNRVTVSEGTIHLRGVTTRTFPKKGFRFSLIQESVGNHERPNHISLLGLRQDDDWLLYAGYNDQEKIRNVFSSNLWQYTCATDNAAGINTGMEYRYLELFINGEYWGLYALGYPIDEKQLQMDPNLEQQALYKTVKWMDETQEVPNIYGFTAEGDEPEQKIELLGFYFGSMYALRDRNDLLLQSIDLDNVIDCSLFLNLIQGDDHIRGTAFKNIILSIRENPNGSFRLYYSPWDMDITWGNGWDGELSVNSTGVYTIDTETNYLLRGTNLDWMLLNGDETAWNALFDKYKSLRADGWSEENINRLLDQYEADIYGSGAFLRDMQRWPDGIYNDASEGLDRFRSYVAARLQAMDRYYAQLEARHG